MGVATTIRWRMVVVVCLAVLATTGLWTLSTSLNGGINRLLRGTSSVATMRAEARSLATHVDWIPWADEINVPARRCTVSGRPCCPTMSEAYPKEAQTYSVVVTTQIGRTFNGQITNKGCPYHRYVRLFGWKLIPFSSKPTFTLISSPIKSLRLNPNIVPDDSIATYFATNRDIWNTGGCNAVLSKYHLVICLEEKRRMGEIPKGLKFIPTYVIQPDLSPKKNQEAFEEMWSNIDLDTFPSDRWMTKVDTVHQGKGVELAVGRENVLRAIAQAAADEQISKHFLVQKALDRPLLMKGARCSYRVNALITSISPFRGYWSPTMSEFLCVQKPEEKEDTQKDRFVSNMSFQGMSKDSIYLFTEIRKALRECDQGQGERCSNISKQEEKFLTITLPTVEQTMKYLMPLSTRPLIHRSNTFQLYGYDFLIDENFYPWLIEANITPGFDSFRSKFNDDTMESFSSVENWMYDSMLRKASSPGCETEADMFLPLHDV